NHRKYSLTVKGTRQNSSFPWFAWSSTYYLVRLPYPLDIPSFCPLDLRSAGFDPWPVHGNRLETDSQLKSGLRHVTIFFSDIGGFSELTRRLGDVEASRIANRLLTLQEIVITRDGLGQVLQFGGDSVFAVFDNASVALNR